MKRIIFVAAILMLSSLNAFAQPNRMFKTPFETSDSMETATYHEAIRWYQQLDSAYTTIQLSQAGEADGGNFLHVVYYSGDGNFNQDQWHREGKTILLINNAIHPGEPDGVDASMMLLRDAASGRIAVPSNVVLAVIPIYNVSGALNRISYSRANQNGPLFCGFRGNAQNLDLNRDFIKCDAAETRSLEHLFATLDPDIFIDNHVSDGADYQHIMTLLATQHDKLGGATGAYMYNTFTPLLYKGMTQKGYDMVPYVNDFENTPDHGWRAFYESPRFSSGYAALFQALAYVPETHMLKYFKRRVIATYTLMTCMIESAGKQAEAIKAARAEDRVKLQTQVNFPLDWQPDTSQSDMITFKGYTADYKTSEVSGLPRLYYDHRRPYTKQVPFYDHFVPTKTVKAPVAYVVPAAWKTVLSRLRSNGVEVRKLARDTSITVTAYHIEQYETSQKPYEKHYLHKQIQVSTTTAQLHFSKGDCIIPTNQRAKRYLVETLEPTAPDGFFAWNFFDGILQQKEYFGDYAFEDLAASILKKDTALSNLLHVLQQSDTAFAKNAAAQLDFVYRHSAYMEPGYMRYPIFRIE